MGHFSLRKKVPGRRNRRRPVIKPLIFEYILIQQNVGSILLERKNDARPATGRFEHAFAGCLVWVAFY